MSKAYRKPKRNDKFWDEKRIREKKQPNGLVWIVDYHEEEVIVRFYTNIRGKYEMEEYSFAELEGKYKPTFGGIYLLYDSEGD